jgi:hypothetical protein
MVPNNARENSKPLIFEFPKGNSGTLVHQEYILLSNHVILILKNITYTSKLTMDYLTGFLQNIPSFEWNVLRKPPSRSLHSPGKR